MLLTQTDTVNAKIEYDAHTVDNKEITKNILNEWRTSQKIEDMKEAQKYSLVQNTAIDKKTRDYKDEHEQVIQNKYLSNVKTKTAQYRKSLLQKLDFVMSKPFVISCDDDEYKKKWDEFLTDEELAVIRKGAKEAINKGIGWAYPWIDENKKLRLMVINSETGYPAWKDEAHTVLDAFVRDYQVIEYINQTPQTVYKVEYWDDKVVEKYIDEGKGNGTGDLVIDTDNKELMEGPAEISIKQTHMKFAKQEGEEEEKGFSWDRVPFIYIKGNEDELPLLNECKSDIDSYDMVKSKGIDSIIDDIDAVLVVEGISAEMGELSRARKILQNSRIVAVDPGGSAKFEKVNSDISAIAQQLDLIRKDIQDNTQTVDVTTIALGSNPSGKAMKTFYEPLNIWANGFESEFRVFMKNLKYFFDMWLSLIGEGNFEELQQIDITFTLDRDMLIDEQEIINNINASSDLLSTETKLEMHPYVDDVEKEMKRVEDERKKEQEEMEVNQFKQVNEKDEQEIANMHKKQEEEDK